MIKPTPTVWMNITTSAGWNRPAVGILRVEQSMSAELAQLYGPCFKYCIWQEGDFIEWFPNKQEGAQSPDVTGNSLSSGNKNPISQPLMFPLLSKRQAIKNIAQGLLSLTPEKFKLHINKLLYFVAPKIKWILSSKLINGIRKNRRNLTNIELYKMASKKDGQIRSKLIFEKNDTLISLGLDWEFDYYKYFYDLRMTHGMKIVTCCYDLIPVLYPQYCVANVASKFTSYFLEIADGSDLVLCISKQSEKDLNLMLETTGGARPATYVFTLGDRIPEMSSDALSAEVARLCKGKFILFVSTIERRKNHEVLYRAYHLLCKQGKGVNLPTLVFVGMQGWGVSELLKDIELDPLTHDLIVQLNHVSDADLAHLYKSSLFCVFPSLYEGWGLPVAEALSFGKAVICSDQGSLPEVGADLVTYVKPWDPQAWADKIYLLFTMDSERIKIEERVKNSYRPRGWVDAATQVKNEIDKLTKSD